MSNEPRLDEERVRLASDLLREAVFSSRAKQAAGTSLARVDPSLASIDRASKTRNCGLGAHAEVELSFSEKARVIATQLWPAAMAPESAASAIAEWVERQDALDRKRNHFLRDFRGANGFDRAKYSSEQLAAFEAGLARVNGEEDRLRDESARKLSRIA